MNEITPRRLRKGPWTAPHQLGRRCFVDAGVAAALQAIIAHHQPPIRTQHVNRLDFRRDLQDATALAGLGIPKLDRIPGRSQSSDQDEGAGRRSEYGVPGRREGGDSNLAAVANRQWTRRSLRRHVPGGPERCGNEANRHDQQHTGSRPNRAATENGVGGCTHRRDLTKREGLVQRNAISIAREQSKPTRLFSAGQVSPLEYADAIRGQIVSATRRRAARMSAKFRGGCMVGPLAGALGYRVGLP